MKGVHVCIYKSVNALTTLSTIHVCLHAKPYDKERVKSGTQVHEFDNQVY